MDEEIAISIRLDAPGTVAEVEKLDHSMSSLVGQNQKLIESNKALAKEGMQTTDAYKSNSLQIDVNKQKIDQNNASRKTLVKTLDDERTNTTKAKDAIGTLSPALSGATTGVVSLGKAMLALALNPVGLVITAIAAALGLVYTFLTRTAGGADMLEDAFTAVTTTIDVLLDRLARVGAGIVAFLSGDFAGGIDKITTAFDGMGKEIAEEVAQATELNEAIRNLEDSEIDLEIASAKTENTVKRLLLQARNRTITEQERLKILEQASQAEEELNKDRLKNATESIKIAATQAAQRLNIIKGEKESEIAFGERLIEAFKGQGAAQADDLRDNLKNAIIAYQQTVGQSLALQEKISNQRDAAQAKIEDQELKEIERGQKQIEQSYLKAQALQSVLDVLARKLLSEAEIAAIEQARIDAVQIQFDNEAQRSAVETEQNEKRLEELNQLFNTEQLLASANKESTEEQAKANNELANSRNANIRAAQTQIKQAQELSNAGQLLSAGFAKQTLAYKAGAITQAVANTWLGVTQVISEKSALPFPLSVIAKAASIAGLVASGFNAVRNITAAAGGGDFITKGPTLLMVGDNPGGVERVTVKPISGKGKTVVGGNMVRAAGGADFTSFGSLTTGSARVAESSFNMERFASMVNQVKIVLPIDSVHEKIAIDEEITTRARVI